MQPPAFGFAAHLALLVAVTVYWQRCITRAYIQAHGGNSTWARGHVVRRRINYCDYWEQWTPLEAALYCAGCCGGALAWLAALALAAAQAAEAARADRTSPLAAPLLPTTAAFVHAVHPSPLKQQPAWAAEEPEESSGSSGSPCMPRRRHAAPTNGRAPAAPGIADCEDDADSCSSARRVRHLAADMRIEVPGHA
ncbi:hypothetical protein ABPG75_003934 [Micractinium tetrahymenae]